MALPEFWLVAGVNGVGKTTLTTRGDIRAVLGDLDLINPDTIAADLHRHDPSLSLDAANLMAVQLLCLRRIADATVDVRPFGFLPASGSLSR